MDQNCRSGWSSAFCTIGNISSTVSMVMWACVLLPQLIRNHQRRSVEGLNVLWALANFTASLCNVFFVFSLSLPLQIRVMAIYMPVLEGIMLCQFLAFTDATTCNSSPRRPLKQDQPYLGVQEEDPRNCPSSSSVSSSSSSSLEEGERQVLLIPTPKKKERGATKHSPYSKISHPCSSREGLPFLKMLISRNIRSVTILCCVLVWCSVIAVEVFVVDGTNYLQWAAVVLWSVETFPQLYTNIRLQSTTGQSVVSVAITCLGKTTDSLTAFLLVMPTQSRVLAYFSATSAWINALHVFIVFSRLPPISSRKEEKGEAGDGAGGGGGGWLSSLSTRSELAIRHSLQRYHALRMFVATWLAVSIVSVTIAVVASVMQWWVAALPVTTCLLLLTIHALTRCCVSSGTI